MRGKPDRALASPASDRPRVNSRGREGGCFQRELGTVYLARVLCDGNPMWSHDLRPGDAPSLRNPPPGGGPGGVRGVLPPPSSGRATRPAQALPAFLAKCGWG